MGKNNKSAAKKDKKNKKVRLKGTRSDGVSTYSVYELADMIDANDNAVSVKVNEPGEYSKEDVERQITRVNEAVENLGVDLEEWQDILVGINEIESNL